MTKVAKENFALTLKCFWGLIFITMSLYQAYDFSVWNTKAEFGILILGLNDLSVL